MHAAYTNAALCTHAVAHPPLPRPSSKRAAAWQRAADQWLGTPAIRVSATTLPPEPGRTDMFSKIFRVLSDLGRDAVVMEKVHLLSLIDKWFN